ncbi:MAG: T9SS type A sorting domain-containing protein [Candidatus Marinimicrobia bacterium]|nr:T9SS type A sorting domain-containing protein [Candidatus Neomarinimicrobiota bacterium]
MKSKKIMTIILAICCLGLLQAQDVYGGGFGQVVSIVSPDSLVLDGVIDEGVWDNAASIDITSYWEGGWNDGLGAEPTVFIDTRLLWAEDTLYVSGSIESIELFLGQDGLEWIGDQLYIQLDPNFDDWAPTHAIHARGIDFSLDSLMNIGEIRGASVVNDDTTGWAFEAAFFVDEVSLYSTIGFTMAGQETTSDTAYWYGPVVEEGWGNDYAWYCWYPNVFPGPYAGWFFSATDNNGFLYFDSTYYGGGFGQEVTRVLPTDLVLDGVPDEAVWDEAVGIDITSYWEGGWNDGLGAEPTVFPETKLFWYDDTLYISSNIESIELFLGQDGLEWIGDQIYVQIDPWFDDWAPTLAIHARDFGFSLDSLINIGEVRGASVVNDDTTGWSFEAAFYVDGIAEGEMIGFTMAGQETTSDTAYWYGPVVEEGWGNDYAWYCWYNNEFPGPYAGWFFSATDNNGFLYFSNDALVGTVNDETAFVPQKHALKQNYPNPFNPTTMISYDLNSQADVVLNVYNILGQTVATLVNENQLAGVHDITWDASGAANGVYFYNLLVNGNRVATRKMILLK